MTHLVCGLINAIIVDYLINYTITTVMLDKTLSSIYCPYNVIYKKNNDADLDPVGSASHGSGSLVHKNKEKTNYFRFLFWGFYFAMRLSTAC